LITKTEQIVNGQDEKTSCISLPVHGTKKNDGGETQRGIQQ